MRYWVITHKLLPAEGKGTLEDSCFVLSIEDAVDEIRTIWGEGVVDAIGNDLSRLLTGHLYKVAYVLPPQHRVHGFHSRDTEMITLQPFDTDERVWHGSLTPEEG